MDQIDAVVVGAGVVGLAVARALALNGLEVVIVERESAIGSGVSSRNSEVIHAGHYYDAGSLKARLCVRGRHRLMAYCAERGIAHQVCGKLVVATTPAELPKLQNLLQRGQVNGVEDLRLISRDEALALEPALHCVGALHSPRTGIVDSHGLMTALLGQAEEHGAMLALKSPFAGARRESGRWVLRTAGEEPFEMAARLIVNCGGLAAQSVAAAIDGFPAQAIPRQFVAKGHYFSLAGRSPFSHLIYPVPVDGGLGVHLTLDLGGQARFGPDVQWLPEGTREADLDYAVDSTRAANFEADIRRYWPQLPAGSLQPAYTGVRPKLSGPGQPAADFQLSGPRDHGCEGLVHLFGIESPGLTSSMALAEEVMRALELPLQ
ncbi:MAG: NAD(P)/FAD-dependent oxidoreductase [Rubrivivax sp.]|nr:NAD(P)/FAD-dependent oxidoreductase [Rubrivivax sp.]